MEKAYKIFILVFLITNVAGITHAQDLGNLKKQKPFIISGSIGASATYYNSNEPLATRPPFSWNVYGNFTPTIYGVALPLSFTVSQFGKSYSQPFSQFGLSPTYKWVKLHLGYRNMQFSPLTYEGQSFRGAGIELTPKFFRFAAFYGKLNRKVNEDTTSGRFKVPQFSRNAYGVKIGAGTTNNHIDFIYLHAKDDSSSAKVINKKILSAQENSVLGTSFKLTLAKKVIVSSDFAISGLTQDISASQSFNDSAATGLSKLMKPFVKSNASTVADWAGQSTLQLILKGYNTTIGYRRVQPNFKSLGTPYILNDISLLNWMNNFSLSKGKLNISTTVSRQNNNLNKKLATELQTLVGNANVNAMLSTHVNLNMNYSGYNIKQKDGTQVLTDSTRLNQMIHQLSFTPSYNTIKENKSHTISGNISYMLLDDKNPVSKNFTNSANLSSSANYTLGLIKKSINFTLSGLYNHYKQDTNYYKSYGATIGSSAQLLKNKSLGVQGTAGYLLNRSSYGNARNNLTFSGNISYHVKHHSLNIYANYIYTPYNPINNIIYNKVAQAVATKNLMGGINYNYSF
ncbi:MAG: hypothetical protein HY252_11580 [Sphingobacteriales bacterium]|nr:hypothetical protein [Sphingobacteriales bacterium]